MASFTDSIPKYNPYISQLPVELMTKVGMAKQQQYEQGIQKIQSTIDNVAGLDVYKDEDKQYLQSRLNQLGNDLKWVGASDFSDFQLVNSVNGMTNQIAKDENILTAVQSTQFLRKQLREMEKAISEGKASQSNIYDLQTKIENWTNDGKVGSSFNGRYIQYRDVKKKAMEAIKALHPKLQTIDIPYVMDSKGNIDYSKIADAMIKEKIEGIDENQIKQAIFAYMDPDDLNQLQLDANYQFRGVDSEVLINRAKTNYDSERMKAIQNLEYIETQLKISSDPVKTDQLTAAKEQYERLLGLDGKPGELDNQFYENVKEARENPDKVKYNIYRDGFVGELANAFSWKNVSREYVTNPLKQQENWEREFRFNQQKEQRDVFESDRDYGLKLKQLEQETLANSLKQAELYGVDAPWYDLGNKTTLKNEAESIYQSNISDLRGKLQGKINILKSKGFKEAEIKDAINKVTEAQGNYKAAGIRPELYRELVGTNGILKLKNDIDSYEEKRKALKEEADRKAGVKSITDLELSKRSSATFTLANGEKVTLTPKEILEIKQAVYNDYDYGKKPMSKGTIESDPGQTAKSRYDLSKLSSKQKRVLASIGVTEKDNTIKENFNSSPVARLINSYNPIAHKINEKLSASRQIYLDNLSEISQEFIPRYKAISKNKDGKYPPLTLSNVSAYVTSLQEQGLEKGENYNASTALGFLSEENIKNTDIFIKNQGDKYQVWIKNKENPEDVQKIDISEENLIKMTGGNKFISQSTREAKKISTGKGNTNLTNNPSRSEFQGRFGDFPSVRNLKVTADLKDVGGGQYYYSINLKKKDGRYQNFTLAGANGMSVVGYDQAKMAITNLTDRDIINQIIEEYPSYDISQIDGVK
jgi:hypothetical protein